MVGNLREHVEWLERVVRIAGIGRVNDHPLSLLVELQKRPQRIVLERLQRFVDRGLAVVAPIGNVLEKQVDLLARNDVADVVGLA